MVSALLEKLKDTKTTTELAILNENLAELNTFLARSENHSEDLMAELSVEELENELHNNCRSAMTQLLDKICDAAEDGVSSIRRYIRTAIAKNESDEIAELPLAQLTLNGIKACTSFAVAGQDVSLAMKWLHLCALSLKQYSGFVTAYPNYNRNKNDICSFLSLLVTPVTTVLIPESDQHAPLFYSNKHPKCILASFMHEMVSRSTNKPKALKLAPDFVPDFGKSVVGTSQSPLVADGPLKVLWERSRASKTPEKSESTIMRKIRNEIKQFLSTFAEEVQLHWNHAVHEPEYIRRLALMYKNLLPILNTILPPSVKLVWEGEQKTPCGMRADVLVSMEYTVRVNGEMKAFKQPIYCAEYKHISSLVSLGMAAVGSSLDKILVKESIKDDYQKYGCPSIVAWDNPQSIAHQCGSGLRTASKSVRQAVVPPFVEDVLNQQVDPDPVSPAYRPIPGNSLANVKHVENMDSKHKKLVCVIAVGIGDGSSHSMALISRKKEDFVGWSKLRYAPDEEDEHTKGEYIASVVLCKAKGMTGNLTNFYKQFLDLEKVAEQPKQKEVVEEDKPRTEPQLRPSLVFSDYLHMNDDENFVFKVARGLANVVAMNIVLNYYHRNFIPADFQNEDDSEVSEYMQHLADSLGDEFKDHYSDVLPKSVIEGNGNDGSMKGSNGDSDDRAPDFDHQDKIAQHSYDRDNGLFYRYVLNSKAKFQQCFMAYLKEENTTRWKFGRDPVLLSLPDYHGIECEGRRTIRDSDGSYRYLIDIGVNTIIGIRDELEALSRIYHSPDSVQVAPEFKDFGFYSYEKIGIELYTIFIHVKGVNGTNGRDSNKSMVSRPIKSLKQTLLRKYLIEHRKLPRSHVIFHDSNAVALNFSNVRFTEKEKSYRYLTTRQLIKVIKKYELVPSSAVRIKEGLEEDFRGLHVPK